MLAEITAGTAHTDCLPHEQGCALSQCNTTFINNENHRHGQLTRSKQSKPTAQDGLHKLRHNQATPPKCRFSNAHLQYSHDICHVQTLSVIQLKQGPSRCRLLSSSTCHQRSLPAAYRLLPYFTKMTNMSRPLQKQASVHRVAEQTRQDVEVTEREACKMKAKERQLVKTCGCVLLGVHKKLFRNVALDPTPYCYNVQTGLQPETATTTATTSSCHDP
jgi:hypothetical protein